jgi:hypothetical protein
MDRLSVIKVSRSRSGATRGQGDEKAVVRLKGVVDRLARQGVEEVDGVGSDGEGDVAERSREGVGSRVGENLEGKNIYGEISAEIGLRKRVSEGGVTS